MYIVFCQHNILNALCAGDAVLPTTPISLWRSIINIHQSIVGVCLHTKMRTARPGITLDASWSKWKLMVKSCAENSLPLSVDEYVILGWKRRYKSSGNWQIHRSVVSESQHAITGCSLQPEQKTDEAASAWQATNWGRLPKIQRLHSEANSTPHQRCVHVGQQLSIVSYET